MKGLVDFINESMNDIAGVDQSIVDMIENAIRFGYIQQKENGQLVKYGVSRENIYDIVDPDEMTHEELDKIIKELERSGIKFKYETDKEWQRDGYKDPIKD